MKTLHKYKKQGQKFRKTVIEKASQKKVWRKYHLYSEWKLYYSLILNVCDVAAKAAGQSDSQFGFSELILWD